jgi:hypothetical protein
MLNGTYYVFRLRIGWPLYSILLNWNLGIIMTKNHALLIGNTKYIIEHRKDIGQVSGNRLVMRPLHVTDAE